MIKIRVLYFASVADRLGKREETISVQQGFDGNKLKQRVVQLEPTLAPAMKSCRVARNQTFVADDELFADGDEVALIPPVSGGSE